MTTMIEYEDGYIEKIEKTGNPAAVSINQLEPVEFDAPGQADEVQGFAEAVDVCIHSRRHRLIDIDNVQAKYVIDALVDAGILRDDSHKEIASVTYTQEKIPSNQEEETVLTLTEAVSP